MRIAVVGGGASGMMAAYAAAKNGAEVVLFERNEKLGKKLFISGKGRCNLTNDSSSDVHMSNVLTNPRFLYSAYEALSPDSLKKLVISAGTPLKTERGARVFPVSDKSSDVIRAFKNMLSEENVSVRLSERVLSIVKPRGSFSIQTEKQTYSFDKVIVCTGGFTYQATGSTGDGYSFASSFGHTVTPLYPSLVGLKADVPTELAGLSLKNVTLTASEGKKIIFSEFGEMLFTHSGVSGPLVLSLSGYINKKEINAISVCIDLKPALSLDEVNARLIREFSAAPNKTVRNVSTNLMPKSLVSFVLSKANISLEAPCHSVTREQRSAFASVLKKLPIALLGFEDFNGAIVTSGGVKTSEINPKDMQSKLVSGLYFAGELLDVDALTGGFNLQIAFSTGYLAGASAATAC